MSIAGVILGITGMILGIAGLYFSLFPLFGALIAGPLVCVGLPLSGIAFFQSRKSKTPLGIPIGIPIAGLATNIVAIVVMNAWVFLLFASEVFASEVFGWVETHWW